MWQDLRKGVAPPTSGMGMASSHTACGSKSPIYTSHWQLTSNMVDCWVINISGVAINVTYAPLHCSDEDRQGAGHELCCHCTLSGLSCMHMQSHSIAGVLIHRIHQSSSQRWAIIGNLVSDHVQSFLEVVWHIV